MLCSRSYVFDMMTRFTKRLRIHNCGDIAVFTEVLDCTFMANTTKIVTAFSLLLTLVD